MSPNIKSQGNRFLFEICKHKDSTELLTSDVQIPHNSNFTFIFDVQHTTFGLFLWDVNLKIMDVHSISPKIYILEGSLKYHKMSVTSGKCLSLKMIRSVDL